MADASPDFRHDTPDYLHAKLDSDPALLARWNDLTPLALKERLAQAFPKAPLNALGLGGSS